jgi:competence transcription factor ComK
MNQYIYTKLCRAWITNTFTLDGVEPEEPIHLHYTLKSLKNQYIYTTLYRAWRTNTFTIESMEPEEPIHLH